MLQLPKTAGLAPAPGDRLAVAVRAALGRLLGVRRGRVEVVGDDGRTLVLTGREPGRTATVRVHDWPAFVRRAARGQAGLAEAYRDGTWDCDDLAALVGQFLSRVAHSGGLLDASWTGRLRRRGRAQANTRAGSRRNIHAHYDLGNSFFEAWLDPGMTYSAAMFQDRVATLEEAQGAKYDRVLEAVRGGPGQDILEIGCGWGGFMEHAARAGARVTGITVSRAQHEYVTRRMASAGLADRASVRFRDYRDVSGSYDAVVSLEMIEAVGYEFWPDYFRQVAGCLAPEGRALIQAITIDPALFEGYRRGRDLVRDGIFPGGLLTTTAHVQSESARAGLRLASVSNFGRDYGRTLACWGERFEARRDALREIGFDDGFLRTWRLYLAACEAGFRRGPIDVGHYLLERDVDLDVA